ncbi:MAG: hypothetical protein ABIC19_03260, partial [Patescibacteria group bacterium]|nr:hypothetical protein [Patescibacteria group bacterium]
FTQNILGANDANNDFDSSTVAANNDGSIVERLEYISQNSAAGTCGNGTVEGGETCDDGNTSWTVGSCAADCSGRNYWSNPKVYNSYLNSHSAAAAQFCFHHGFNDCASLINTPTLTSSSSSVATSGYGGHYATFVSLTLGLYPDIFDQAVLFYSHTVNYSSMYNFLIEINSVTWTAYWGTFVLIPGQSKFPIVWFSTAFYGTGSASTVKFDHFYTLAHYTSEIWCTD